MSNTDAPSARIEAALAEALTRMTRAAASDGPPDAHRPPEHLVAAMRYAVLSPGKRLRPKLALAAAEAVGGRADDALPAACAVEMIHAYSLVHDDLPSMDDDDLRRGQPSCHKQFDEATALLAGDALLTEAFAVLSDPEPFGAGRPLSPDSRARAVRLLARAAGGGGMVGGQQDDVDAEGQRLDAGALIGIHRRKTGRLIQVSAVLGALCGGGTEDDIDRLGAYGTHVGLAFQLVDDVLDDDGVAAAEGAEKTRQQAHEWTAQALAALEPYGASADVLRAVAREMASRLV